MISPRTKRYLIVSVLALIGPVAWAGEPNETPIHLEFRDELHAIRAFPVRTARLTEAR